MREWAAYLDTVVLVLGLLRQMSVDLRVGEDGAVGGPHGARDGHTAVLDARLTVALDAAPVERVATPGEALHWREQHGRDRSVSGEVEMGVGRMRDW